MVSNIAVTITENQAVASAYLLVLISKDGNHRSLPPGRYACELIKETAANGASRAALSFMTTTIGDAVLPFAQCLDQRIDAVAHDSEHMGSTPRDQCLDQNVRRVQVIVEARRRLRRTAATISEGLAVAANDALLPSAAPAAANWNS